MQFSLIVGVRLLDVVAGEAAGEERERLYRTQAERAPQFAEYEAQSGGRVIPVRVLTPTTAA